MKNLLAISASPRRNGNSEVLLSAFLEGVAGDDMAVETIKLNPLNIKPCQACDRCSGNGKCIVQDDMQALYPKVLFADALILATPIYFGSMAAQLKIFIDRFQCWWHAKYGFQKPFINPAEERPGYLICAGALQNPIYCESAEGIAKVYFHNVNFNYAGMLCARGYDEKGSLAQDSGKLDEARKSGEQFATEFFR